MPARTSAKCRFETAADLLVRLGNIPPDRVRLNPPPGRVTKWDLIRFRGPGQYELIDRVLVSKGISPYRGYLVAELSAQLGNAVERQELGALFGPGAWVEVLPGVIRNPDVSFVPWERFPERRVPMENISRHVPALAVEVLSPSNTRKEMQIKLKEYFLGGVKLVWIIDPDKRTAEVYTAPDKVVALPPDGTLDGGIVLPGFALPLATLFTRLGPPAKKQKGKKKK
jgi:Uma2 family endonuclease